MKDKTSGGGESKVERPKVDAGELRRVPLEKIVPSPFQNRKTFQTADWPGFVESVKISGVIQPGVGREVNGQVELVCGERRFRASQELKLPDMPLIIRKLTDADVQEIIAVENLQREGLNPFEEAMGFADWIAHLHAGGKGKSMKEAVAYISERIGKGRTIIYESLRLLKSSDAVKKALEKGEIDLTKAALIAGVAPAAQAKLLQEVLRPRYGNQPLSAKLTRELIAKEYQRQLNQAPFKQDAELKGSDAKGPRTHPLCTTCLMRSGNIDGFEGNPNVCTNVVCFQAKTDAHVAAELAAAAKAGGRTLDPEQYKNRSYDYHKTNDTCYGDTKGRSYGTLAKLAGVEPILTADNDGNLVQVFSREDEKTIKAANKIKDYSSGGGYNAVERKAQAALTKKKKEFDAMAKLATGKILETLVTTKGIDTRLWLLLSDRVAQEAGIERTTFVAKRLGLAKTQNEANETLEAWLTDKARTDLDRMRFIVEVLLCAPWLDGGWNKVDWREEFVSVCKLAGGTPEKLASAAEKEKPKEQKPAKDAKGTKAKTKKK